MKLSKRLQAIYDYVTEGNRVADVGTDHAYLPIALIEAGKAPSAIAADIGKGPLERAKEHIALYGFEDKIETRLSNGLEKFSDGECDTLIIAGMGGGLMKSILVAGKNIHFKEYVLEPQSETQELRRYLAENGFAIDRETMVYEDGKFYPVMHVIPVEAGSSDSRENDLYGDPVIQENKAVLQDFLQKEEETLGKLVQHLLAADSEAAKQRRQELEAKLQANRHMQQRLQALRS